MALPFHALNAIKPYLKGDVLSLGYPDLTVTESQIEQLFGYKPTKFTDSAKWHGRKDKLPETYELFEHLGVSLTVVDYVQGDGIQKVADLNYPQAFGRFDLVIDPGTLEHCFNIGQAMLNAANSVKVGGVILHLSPMTMLNHGFYNLNPTFFYDFYIQNGWDMNMKVLPANLPEIHQTKRFDMSSEYLIRVLAERKTDESLKFPTQTKYLEKNK